MMAAENRYGRVKRWKLMPLESIAIISLRSARREVKKITAMKVNSGLNWLSTKGKKFMKYWKTVAFIGAVSTASSFSLMSNTTTMANSNRMAKKKVPRNFLMM